MVNRDKNSTHEKLLEQIVLIARKAGDAIMDVYGSEDFGVEIKEEAGFSSPLTKADKAANDIILERLAKISDHPIISEEGSDFMPKPGSSHLSATQGGQEERASRTYGTESERSYPADTAMRQKPAGMSSSAGQQSKALREPGRFWLVDPLDGTKEFVSRNGEFTVNIALIENGEPVLGVVYAPAKKLLYWGAKDSGAFKQENDDSAKKIYSVYEGDMPTVIASRSHRGEDLEKFIDDIGEHEEISMGSSLKLCLVAEGAASVYPRFTPTHLWDTAAADAVVRAAGGTVCDFDGKLLKYNLNGTLKNPYFVVRAGE